MKIQESGEMYLETIYVLSKKGGTVRSVDVGEYMGFSKPSVSRAIHLLKQAGLVDMEAKSGHLSLTTEGQKIAEKIYERHEILTIALKALGVPDEIALADACKIEHDISDTTFEAIKKHISQRN